ncbi:MAG: helix-turn-helix transcriptional regulator [Acidimicrobiia bacterium]
MPEQPTGGCSVPAPASRTDEPRNRNERRHPNQIHALRLGAGYSTGAVAVELNVSAQTIWRYERGATRPSQSSQLRLTQLFGCTLDELGL